MNTEMGMVMVRAARYRCREYLPVRFVPEYCGIFTTVVNVAYMRYAVSVLCLLGICCHGQLMRGVIVWFVHVAQNEVWAAWCISFDGTASTAHKEFNCFVFSAISLVLSTFK
jgi:hypothetical protein